jgi:hydroxymethylbilane synthase
VPKREDPRDAFLSQKYSSIADLPDFARVGTSSLRRQAQLQTLGRRVDVVALRGNVDTRLRKLQQGEFDAIILAAAGLTRLGLHAAITEYISPEQMCPAAGQGALAIECRSDDRKTVATIEFLEDSSTRAAVECERALLNSLGGGCQVPIGAYAEPVSAGLLLRAVVASPDGREIVREQRVGVHPTDLGAMVGKDLLARGAARILNSIQGEEVTVPQQP